MVRKWLPVKLGVIGLVAGAALVCGVGSAAAFDAKDPLTIHFVKQCPANTCTGELVREDGREIPNSSDYWAPTSTSVRSWPLVNFTAVETVSAAQGSLTIASTGVIDCAAVPTTVVATGTVVSGEWEGHDLTGSTIQESGQRVSAEKCGHPLNTTFAGTLLVYAG